jgi:hypothetical protein
VKPIVDIEIKDQQILALSPSKLFIGNIGDVLLPSPQGWTQDNRVPLVFNSTYAAIEKVNEEVFVLQKTNAFGNDTILKLTPTEFVYFDYYSVGLEIANLTQHENNLNIIIEDNGKGFDPKTINKNEGMGLHHIEKKTEQLGGNFSIDSSEGRGTSILIDLPL